MGAMQGILVALIVAEVAFWACLLLGLVLRYRFDQPKLGAAFLIATPIIDIGLLAYAFTDLAKSGQASFFHGFSAFYVAFTIVFGRDTVQAMDRRFRGASEIEGAGFNRSIRDNLLRCVIACAIAALILGGLIWVTGLGGSFWLIYWLVVVVFMPVMWWGIDTWLARRRERKTTRSANDAHA